LERVKQEFDELTWKAFDITWLRDQKTSDAAKQLNKPKGWIYKARYRVVQRLRSELEFMTNDAALFHRPS
jgi:hypothetical protein